ncbi:dihydroxyacetone kinase family protein [Streptomyces sp. 35G-GA-8]|uniref:dihydroxyacetone kinase family protein n=1 Tax=Streptomyces sp. 35G-GA-8 TaxID=2939434 RepID=UPI00201EB2F9|nr:dihydroxyacetone kinase family protein [Streptomyces sp. 35G-GA-8]MCL7375695.1 dihydroxyacetone kinase family protein [Streptomyces sp. 35G-GA-8]
MTVLTNDPGAFADEALAGFAAAHAEEIRALHGGVVRASATPPGRVAVVIGGGTGHYPAFAGWVGPGFAHGAACGHVFASPSASQICSVARAADSGGGVILGFGNYAGDILHFGRAAEQLRAEGMEVRTLTVTDDIASGPADNTAPRRGIGGDFSVLKILGGAAEAGLGIDAAVRAGRRANAATRSLGLAFGGCTLPGADRPLFTVPAGRMSVGLGIHGEPGIAELPLPTADGAADLLVDRILAERAVAAAGVGGSDRVALLLNGLGGTKYEELYVVHRRVAERLAAEGLTVVAPVVGEQVTSLGMAGLSLTLTFLDDELEALWTAPAATPAFRRGVLAPRPPRTDDLTLTHRMPLVVPGDPRSRALGARLAEALLTVRDTVVAHETRLGDLDAVAGDGDHGIGMRRGAEAAAVAAREAVALGAGAGTVLAHAGAAWSERAGGTSGALWGAALTSFGAVLGDHDGTAAGRDAGTAGHGGGTSGRDGGTAERDGARLTRAVRAAVDTVLRIGGARPGDKTLVDAAVPFADRLEAALPTAGFTAAWAQAARAAGEAAEATAGIAARLGRARTHGVRGLGSPDPGAISFALIVAALTPRSPGSPGPLGSPDSPGARNSPEATH